MNLNLIRLLVKATACGDALGATSEFLPRSQMPSLYQRLRSQNWPFRQVGGGPFNWRPGQHTDDTDMALCIVRSFLDCDGEFDPADIASHFVGWLHSGPPDVGMTIRRVLSRIAQGVPWCEAGYEEFLTHPQGAANGSLMRNGVVVALAETLPQAFEYTLKQGIITHYHPLPVLCCSVQIWLLWELFEERWPFQVYEDWLEVFHRDWTDWITASRDPQVKMWLARVEKGAVLTEAMETLVNAEFDPDQFNPFQTKLAGRDGYCLLTLQIALWALQWAQREPQEYPFAAPDGFAAEVFGRRMGWTLGWVPLLGHDSDTYAATAGPLIAAATGGELPASMTAGLEVLREPWLFEAGATSIGEGQADRQAKG